MSQPKAAGALQALQHVSQEYETKLVIELGTDRIVKWLGVYFIFILATLLKVEEILGSSQNLTCLPENYLEPVSKTIIEFATRSCWESSEIGRSTEHCVAANATNSVKINNASAKIIIKLLPLVWFVLAFLNYLPTLWWHLSYGSRLLGHLKLIQYVLESTCQAINELKEVEYNGSPYDSNSVHLTGKKLFYDPVIAIALEQILNEARWLKDKILTIAAVKRDITDSYQKLIDNHLNDSSNSSTERNKLKQKLVDNIDYINQVQLHSNAQRTGDNSQDSLLMSLNKIVEACLKDNQAGKRLSDEQTTNLTNESTKFTNETNIDCDEINEKHEECYMLIEGKDLYSNSTDERSNQTFREECNLNKRLKQQLLKVKKNIDKLNEIKQSNKEITTCVETIKNKLNWNLQEGNKTTRSKMRDRHFLSLLCYENFASLYYIPYIYQVFRVYGIRAFHTSIKRLHALEQRYIDQSIPKERGTVTKPTSEAVLRSWCHPKNLTSNKLVCSYRKKQIGTIGIALIGFSLHLYFFIILPIENLSSQSYFCALPHICFICSLNRLSQLTVLIGIVLASFLVIIFVLCYQLVDFNECKHQSSDCCFFELFQDLSMDALYGVKAENAGNSSFYVNQSNSNTSNNIYSTDKRTTDYVFHNQGDSHITFVNEQAQKSAGYSKRSQKGQVIKNKQTHNDRSFTETKFHTQGDSHFTYKYPTPEASKRQFEFLENAKNDSHVQANNITNDNTYLDHRSNKTKFEIGGDSQFNFIGKVKNGTSTLDKATQLSLQPEPSTTGSSQKNCGSNVAQMFDSSFSNNESSASTHASSSQDQRFTSCPLKGNVLSASKSEPSFTMKETAFSPQHVFNSSNFRQPDANTLNENACDNQSIEMNLIDFSSSLKE